MMFNTQGVVMKKKFLSAVLAVGLFSGAATVQADLLQFNQDTTGFWFETVTDFWTGEFVVDYSLDPSGVVLWTDSYGSNFTNSSFDPFLVVWDSNGNQVAYNNNWDPADGACNGCAARDAYINLGTTLAEGTYSFTIGNWPNGPVSGGGFEEFATPPGQDLTVLYPDRGQGQWNVWINGVTPVPVPEPETWAMLLAGLGIVGAVARRRK